jgi:hypothetical protein
VLAAPDQRAKKKKRKKKEQPTSKFVNKRWKKAAKERLREGGMS